jgi:hypothetical protein
MTSEAGGRKDSGPLPGTTKMINVTQLNQASMLLFTNELAAVGLALNAGETAQVGEPLDAETFLRADSRTVSAIQHFARPDAKNWVNVLFSTVQVEKFDSNMDMAPSMEALRLLWEINGKEELYSGPELRIDQMKWATFVAKPREAAKLTVFSRATTSIVSSLLEQLLWFCTREADEVENWDTPERSAKDVELEVFVDVPLSVFETPENAFLPVKKTTGTIHYVFKVITVYKKKGS